MKVRWTSLHQMFEGTSESGIPLVCQCSRLLTWERMDGFFRAVCVCGQVYLETNNEEKI